MSKPFWTKFVSVEAASEIDPVEDTGRVPGNLPKDEDVPIPTAPVAPPPAKRAAMDWTLEDVFQAGGAETGRNSAETVLKLKDSLAAFPENQQVAMVRAMDMADDTWSEVAVTADAQRRIQVLDRYLGLVGQDEDARVKQITAAFDETKRANDARVADLDVQIAALQAEREKTLQATAAAQASADEQAKGVKERANGVRSSVAGAVERYKGLLKFFGL